MPHRNGHTVINMNSRSRSRSGSRSPRPGHEHPSVHSSGLEVRVPVRGLSPSSDRSAHNNHHNGHRNNAETSHSNTNLHHESEKNPMGENIALLVRNRRELDDHHDKDHAQPLLETDDKHPKIPLAGPEIDDLDDDAASTASADDHTGIDDGFFADPKIEGRFGEDDGTGKEVGFPKAKGDDDDDGGSGDEADGIYIRESGNYLTVSQPMLHGSHTNLSGNGVTRFNVNSPFPHAPEFGPGVEVRITPDVNVYQQKKNLAQGMMDLALLSANANQLRYVLEAGDLHPYYYPSMIFISASLILQIAVGVGLIINSRYNVKEHEDICKADRINDFTVIGIFLITIVNVFIASFGVATSPNMIRNTS